MRDINAKNDLCDLMDRAFADIVLTLKKKISQIRFSAPVYNAISHRIEFAGVEIQIPYNSDQDQLCKTIFKDTASIKKEWSWDEMVENWEDADARDENWRTVYNAGREINNKIAAETTVKDLLLVRKLTIAVNPKYSKS